MKLFYSLLISLEGLDCIPANKLLISASLDDLFDLLYSFLNFTCKEVFIVGYLSALCSCYSLLYKWYLVTNSSFFSGQSQQRAGDDSASPHHLHLLLLEKYICAVYGGHQRGVRIRYLVSNHSFLHFVYSLDIC